jgi:hypothetical protein
MEEAGVSIVIRGLRVVEVPDRTLGEEQAEERTRAADADGERPGRERGLESRANVSAVRSSPGYGSKRRARSSVAMPAATATGFPLRVPAW